MLHVTLKENRSSIVEFGLLRSCSLIVLHKTEAELPCPRPETVTLRGGGSTARLNHQKPLLAGRSRQSQFLDIHSIESWAHQLDQRLFLWPKNRQLSFSNSLVDRGEIVVLECDAAALFERYSEHLFLAPINTGSSIHQPALRGDWIYVSVLATKEEFQTNRISRGLGKCRDRVKEVSMRCDIAPSDVEALFQIT